MSEAGTQIGVARVRAGAIVGLPAKPAAADPAAVVAPAGLPPPDEVVVRAALAEVMDPELPIVSIVDLGMVGDVTVDHQSGEISVEILPTFVGCPALGLIRAAAAERLATLGAPVRVEMTFRVPWTSDRITPAGRAALAAVGIAGPSAPDAVRCPWCASSLVVLDSSFGPTQCRSLYYCRECRQPFEAIKPV